MKRQDAIVDGASDMYRRGRLGGDSLGRIGTNEAVG
jgi:hypothetical protein